MPVSSLRGIGKLALVSKFAYGHYLCRISLKYFRGMSVAQYDIDLITKRRDCHTP